MDEGLRSVLNWAAVWLGFILLSTGLINFFMHGLFYKYFRAKASRGKLLLINVDALTGRYVTTGIITEGALLYKKRHQKNKSRLNNIPKGSVYHYLGVKWVDVDEELNAVRQPDYKGVSGFDAERMNDLYHRALDKPSPHGDNKTLKLIKFFCIGIGIAVIVVGIMVYQSYKQVLGLGVI